MSKDTVIFLKATPNPENLLYLIETVKYAQCIGEYIMSDVLPPFIKSESFRFSPLKCRDLGISLQAAKFLRWLYLEPQRTNGQISATFGLTLAFSMLDAGYVCNPLDESETVSTNLWNLTEKGVEALAQLAGVK